MNYETARTSDNKTGVIASWQRELVAKGYTLEEVNADKPWGGFIRLNNGDDAQFVEEHFADLTLEEAKLGKPEAEISPKILIVSPGERLSWQKHHRRAERWKFLTEGGYVRSDSDEEGDLRHAAPGEVVQFGAGERHRLVGTSASEYTLVAEIWQHVDPENLSNEDDIVRIQDDYKR